MQLDFGGLEMWLWLTGVGGTVVIEVHSHRWTPIEENGDAFVVATVALSPLHRTLNRFDMHDAPRVQGPLVAVVRCSIAMS